MVMASTWSVPGQNAAKLQDRPRIDQTGRRRMRKFAVIEALRNRVRDEHVSSLDERRTEFRLTRRVGTNGSDVRPGADPLGFDQGHARRGGGDHHIGATAHYLQIVMRRRKDSIRIKVGDNCLGFIR